MLHAMDTCEHMAEVRGRYFYDALSEQEFRIAVRRALRRIRRTDGLTNSPLLRTRLVAHGLPSGASTAEREARLRARVFVALDWLARHSGNARHAAVLRRTVFGPEAKGLAIADELGLPFGSYRRILSEAHGLFTDVLWRWEVEPVLVDNHLQ